MAAERSQQIILVTVSMCGRWSAGDGSIIGQENSLPRLERSEECGQNVTFMVAAHVCVQEWRGTVEAIIRD